jgi:hypothetical protein
MNPGNTLTMPTRLDIERIELFILSRSKRGRSETSPALNSVCATVTMSNDFPTLPPAVLHASCQREFCDERAPRYTQILCQQY